MSGIKKMAVLPTDVYISDTIFIGNLDIRVTEKELRDILGSDFVGDILIRLIPHYNSSYAFAKFVSSAESLDVVDIGNILEYFVDHEFLLYNRRIRFGMVKKSGRQEIVKKSFFSCLEKQEELDQPFCNDAENPDEACIHFLIDEALLHIFSYLKTDDLFSCETVCKRFQYLVTSIYVKKLRKYTGGCFKSWLFANNISDSFLSAKIILKNAGYIMKKIEIHKIFKDLQMTIFLISEYCPNLEELIINSTVSFIQTNYMARLGEKCTNLKKLVLKGRNTFNDRMFYSIFANIKSLEVLEIYSNVEVTRKGFRYAQSQLKEFSVFGFMPVSKYQRMSPWKKLFVACRKLEVLNISTKITHEELMNAAKFCHEMKELSVHLAGEESSFSWQLFPKLKKLTFRGVRFDLAACTSNEFLEDLTILDRGTTPTTVIGNFSEVRSLQRLTIKVNLTENYKAILNSISDCTELKYLNINATIIEIKELALCIKKLDKLTELHCKDVTIRDQDIPLLIASHRGKTKTLKLTIGMDEGAFQKIEHLHEVGYEVSVFDVNNIFTNDFDRAAHNFDDIADHDIDHVLAAEDRFEDDDDGFNPVDNIWDPAVLNVLREDLDNIWDPHFLEEDQFNIWE